MGIYLGFDSSTQGIKALLIDIESARIIASASSNYSADFPEFGCSNGVLPNSDPLVKHSDPLLWLASLDWVLEKLKSSGAPMDKVRAISGSGQQHGSVYLNDKFLSSVSQLDPSKNLPDQIKPALSRKTSPIWMDSSTGEECREISRAIGAEALQQKTGSPAIERFTGPQIRKFYKDNPDAYAKTKYIHLVSSFMASVLCGRNAPIDYGDGAGMNLLNLQNLRWDIEIAKVTAPGLLERLPKAACSSITAGALHPYFRKYGLPEGIPVILWSGDNPCSLIGVGASTPGTAVISLGTSDTFFAAMPSPHVDPEGYGHVFGNPAGGFMSLICFKNGSLAREKIKDECGVDWEYFDKTAFKKTKPGNNGNILLPYFVPETTPLVLNPGTRYTGTPEFCNGRAEAAVKIRAIAESQALAMRLHSQWINTAFSCVRITGGASKSPGLCQVLADVFQSKLEKLSIPDSAALGAAMRAANAEGKYSWLELNKKFAAPTEVINPNPNTSQIYNEMLEKFAEFERKNIK